MTDAGVTYEGACHCEAVGYVFRTELPPRAWTLRACQCRFCRAHAVVTTSDPEGTLQFVASDPSALNRYRFGLHTADFLICRNCGVYIGAVMQGTQGRFGIINVHALRAPAVELATSTPRDYGAERADERNARRERQWTPVVGCEP